MSLSTSSDEHVSVQTSVYARTCEFSSISRGFAVDFDLSPRFAVAHVKRSTTTIDRSAHLFANNYNPGTLEDVIVAIPIPRRTSVGGDDFTGITVK